MQREVFQRHSVFPPAFTFRLIVLPSRCFVLFMRHILGFLLQQQQQKQQASPLFPFLCTLLPPSTEVKKTLSPIWLTSQQTDSGLQLGLPAAEMLGPLTPGPARLTRTKQTLFINLFFSCLRKFPSDLPVELPTKTLPNAVHCVFVRYNISF